MGGGGGGGGGGGSGMGGVRGRGFHTPSGLCPL